ncbi:hypothetical protein [Actinoplanes subtropicus]|uniref:hypothetical protein n=1 Tax=Actinoplanes subtropicus TaxID=543632 RepID=UPI0004C357D7|nr:hypothetical protein [Actinoplanes subtropicus]
MLTAETVSLRRAAFRALKSLPGPRALVLFDFGYGTGRVTNEFALDFPRCFGDFGRDLHVVAYDVSAVGLDKAARKFIKEYDFDELDPLSFDMTAEAGYVAGSVRRIFDSATVTVTFVHGSEGDDSGFVGGLVRSVNGGGTVSMTTSWYSALAHIPGQSRRAAFFEMLAAVTDPGGELMVAPSVLGDLVDLQKQWRERRLEDDVAGLPIEVGGDVIYETELAQSNFWHVFGPDLWQLLQENANLGQTAWLEAIRLPDEEFRSRAEEQANFRRTRAFNRRIGRRPWREDDFREVHTAVAIRSGSPDAAVS